MRAKLVYLFIAFSVLLNAALLVIYQDHIKADAKKLLRGKKEVPSYPTRLFHLDSYKEISQLQTTLDEKDQVKTLKDSLIVKPGLYRFPDGEVYQLEKEGLYRFFNGQGNRQVMVYDQDLVSLMSAIMWSISHGNRDNKHLSQWKTIWKGRAMALTCGYMNDLASQVLSQHDIEHRVVQFATSCPKNGFDDEHVMIEAFDPVREQWILFDTDNNCVFTDSSGKMLNLVQWLGRIPDGNYLVKEVAADPKLGPGGFETYYFAMSMLLSKKGLRSWYERICQNVNLNGRDYHVLHNGCANKGDVHVLADLERLKGSYSSQFTSLQSN